MQQSAQPHLPYPFTLCVGILATQAQLAHQPSTHLHCPCNRIEGAMLLKHTCKTACTLDASQSGTSGPGCSRRCRTAASITAAAPRIWSCKSSASGACPGAAAPCAAPTSAWLEAADSACCCCSPAGEAADCAAAAATESLRTATKAPATTVPCCAVESVWAARRRTAVLQAGKYAGA